MSLSFAQMNEPLFTVFISRQKLIRERQIVANLAARAVAEGGGIMRLLPVPFLFDAQAASELAQAATELIRTQSRLINNFIERMGRDRFLDFFHVPEAMKRFVNWDELQQPENLIARFDVLETSEGFSFCEFNVDSCVAGAEMFDFARDYFGALGVKIEDGCAVRAPLRDLAVLLADLARRRAAERLVILDVSAGGGSAGKGYFSFERLRQYITQEAGGIPVLIADETTYPTEWTKPVEAARTVVYRGFPMDEMTDDGVFLESLIRGGACVINTYETEIRMNKAWFSIFHEDSAQACLSARDRELIARYIPKTFTLTEQNFREVLAAKDEYIFKKKQSYGGRGICIGKEMAREPLSALICESGGAMEWTAQRLLEPLQAVFPGDPVFRWQPQNLVFGLYLYGATANGMLVRASATSKVVNVTAGHAGIGWAVSVGEEEKCALLSQMTSAS